MSQQLLDPATMAALQQRFSEVPVGGAVLFPENQAAIRQAEENRAAGLPPGALVFDPAQVAPPSATPNTAAITAAQRQQLERMRAEPDLSMPSTEQKEALANRAPQVTVPSGAGAFRKIAKEQEAKADEAKSRAVGAASMREEANDLELDARLAQNNQARFDAQAQLEASLQQQRVSKEAMDAARVNAEKYRRQVADEMEFASHANMTRGAYDQAKATLANPNAGPKERMAAERALAKGKELDAGAWMGEEPWMRVLVGIGMAISAGMEGYAAGLQGRASNSHQVIQNAIQRGLEQQKAKFAKHEEASVARASYYDQLLEKFGGDAAAADAAYIAAGTQAAIARGDLAAASRADQDAQVAWAKERAALVEQMNENIDKATQHMGDNAYKAALAGAEAQAAAARQQAALSAKGDGQGGRPLPRPTMDMLAEMESGKRRLNEMRDAFNKVGPEALLTQFVPGTDARNYDKAMKLFKLQIRKIVTGVAGSPKEMDEIMSTIPSSYTTRWDAKPMFEALEHFIAGKEQEVKRIYGAQGHNLSGVEAPEEQEQDDYGFREDE